MYTWFIVLYGLSANYTHCWFTACSVVLAAHAKLFYELFGYSDLKSFAIFKNSPNPDQNFQTFPDIRNSSTSLDSYFPESGNPAIVLFILGVFCTFYRNLRRKTEIIPALPQSLFSGTLRYKPEYLPNSKNPTLKLKMETPP